MKAYLIGLVLALLLVVGCSDSSQDTVVTGQVVAPAQVSVSDDVAESKVVEYEVYMKSTFDSRGEVESEELFPKTMSANVGDTVKLVFLLDEPRFIEIESINFAEKVQFDTVEFVAKEAGLFSVMCKDCIDTDESLLRVQ